VRAHSPHTVRYLLRTVKVGISATWIVLTALLVYLIAATDAQIVHRTLFLGGLIAAAAGAAVIAALPWPRLLEGQAGMWVLYAWSALDISLITMLLYATGGSDSPLFVIYALTTVFFSASYPRVAQAVLLAFTFIAYAIVSLIGQTDFNFGGAAARCGTLVALALIASFLSDELLRQNAELEAEVRRHEATEAQLRQREVELKAAQEAERRLEELQLKQTQALEINDSIVQGLVVARYALSLGETERTQKALDRTLDSAKGIVGELLAAQDEPLGPGDLVRGDPASSAPDAAIETEDTSA
jgi:hypothetical protein